jgi:hypothetical protein
MKLISTSQDLVELQKSQIVASFFNGGELNGISIKEIENLAGKKKRIFFRDSGLMERLLDESELAFQEFLKSRNLGLYRRYINARKGQAETTESRDTFQQIANEFPEQDFKNKYLTDALVPSRISEKHYFTSAIEDIISRRRAERRRALVKRRAPYGEQLDNFLESLKINTSDIHHLSRLEEIAFQHMSGNNPLTILFYFCLRQTHNRGYPSITPHLESTIKETPEGRLERRTGLRYISQISEIKLFDF